MFLHFLSHFRISHSFMNEVNDCRRRLVRVYFGTYMAFVPCKRMKGFRLFFHDKAKTPEIKSTKSMHCYLTEKPVIPFNFGNPSQNCFYVFCRNCHGINFCYKRPKNSWNHEIFYQLNRTFFFIKYTLVMLSDDLLVVAYLKQSKLPCLKNLKILKKIDKK